MDDQYAYPIDQCDVQDKKGLQQYRAKRRVWLSWLETDEHHAIWNTLHSLVWTDVAFRSLTAAAANPTPSALHNSLVAEALIHGHFATQILAIRRLVDGNSDVISLRRLVKDIKRHVPLLTRELFVCHDGLPYDYERVQREEMQARFSKGASGAFWADTSGPQAWGTSQLAHQQFDRLCGVPADRRSRTDIIPSVLLRRIEGWLNESGASELEKWSHVYLAHAGGPEARKQLAAFQPTNVLISNTIRNLARVAESLSAYVLWASGRSHALLPVPQFDVFEGLGNAVMSSADQTKAYGVWDSLQAERDAYLDGVLDDLAPEATT